MPIDGNILEQFQLTCPLLWESLSSEVMNLKEDNNISLLSFLKFNTALLKENKKIKDDYESILKQMEDLQDFKRKMEETIMEIDNNIPEIIKNDETPDEIIQSIKVTLDEQIKKIDIISNDLNITKKDIEARLNKQEDDINIINSNTKEFENNNISINEQLEDILKRLNIIENKDNAVGIVENNQNDEQIN